MSASVMGASGLWESSDVGSRAEMKDYAEDAFVVLLRSTLNLEDCGLNLSQPVDVYILSRTNDEDDLRVDAELADCDMLLHNLTKSLILERYGFALTSTYLNETSGRRTRMVFGPEEGEPDDDSFELGWTYSMIGFGKPGETRIGLEIWRR